MRVAVTYPPLIAPDGVSQATLGQNRQFQWFHQPFIYISHDSSQYGDIIKTKRF